MKKQLMSALLLSCSLFPLSVIAGKTGASGFAGDAQEEGKSSQRVLGFAGPANVPLAVEPFVRRFWGDPWRKPLLPKIYNQGDFGVGYGTEFTSEPLELDEISQDSIEDRQEERE